MSERFNLPRWWLRAVILSVIICAFGYLGFSLWTGWRDVCDAIVKVGVLGVAISLSMSLLNYALRFIRWQMYLRTLGHRVPLLASLKIYLAGFALTTTPGKAGETLRSVLLERWGVPYPQSFAAFFSERLSDLLAVVLLTLFGLTLYPQAGPVFVGGAALVMVSFVILSRKAVLERLVRVLEIQASKVSRLFMHLCRILLEAHRCNRLGMLLLATSLSLIAWAAEALAFYWVLGWMGAEVSLAFAIFVYSLSMLAGALSFMPGGLGGAEGAMVTLLVWNGMPASDAIAATLVIRLATLWFAVAIGGSVLLRGGWEQDRRASI